MAKKHRDATGVLVGVVGVLAALTAAVMVVRRALKGSARGTQPRQHMDLSDPDRVKSWVIGRSRQSVAAALGLPPITTPAPPGPDRVTPERAVHWRADVWYYPLIAPRRRAMAIRFKEGIARSVEFITPPGEISRTSRREQESG